MKNQVILRRALNNISMPLIGFILPFTIIWVLLWQGVFHWLGVAATPPPLPMGMWLMGFATLAYLNVQSNFNLGLQTGVSRRHLFQILMSVWLGNVVAAALVLGVWSWLTPTSQLFVQELGYRGSPSTTVQIANAVLVTLSLMVAVLAGIALKLATLTVAPDYRWWIGLACLVVIWWLAASQYSAQATQYLAQFVWLWPALLSFVGVALLIYIWHQFQVLEPTT